MEKRNKGNDLDSELKYLGYLQKNSKPEPHQHQYITPVEWFKRDIDGHYTVTVLRCVCGEETKR